jgi:predicted RNase H-like HicB family nuclease
MGYVAIAEGKPGAYLVTIPDLPGCTSAGKTIELAVGNAIEAVRLWIEGAEADGKKVPKPRALAELVADPSIRTALAKGAVLVAVPVVRDLRRPVKANVSLDAGVLEAIDAAAKRHKLTRSAYLASAALEKIRRGA